MHEHAVEQRLERNLHALFEPRRRLADARGLLGDGEDVVEVGVLERDDGGHRLGERRHRGMRVGRARPQDVALGVAENPVLGVDGGRFGDVEAAVVDRREADVVVAVDRGERA